jgi:2-amino-4-hydroxy-6-hydroxymethyldihydropteridine diphosphokinase
MGGARRAVLGLGSNLGDRVANIAAAVRAIGEEAGVELVARSPIYETAPVGGPPQGDYLNAAVLVRTALGASDLVARALAVEAKLGRLRTAGVRDAPRTIDVDVLWIEGERFDDGKVTVPHPRLAGRAFAVRPLVDVAPDARDPASGGRYADLPAAKEPLAIIES